MLVEEVVDKEVTKVVEQVNTQQKVYLCRSTKIKLEVVMDVVLDEVDKEVTKVEKLVKEVNEGLVLVYIHGDSRRGYHKKSGFRMIWCWTRRLTWRSTRRLTRRWPTLSKSWWFRS